jgi:hypothetical protein
MRIASGNKLFLTGREGMKSCDRLSSGSCFHGKLRGFLELVVDWRGPQNFSCYLGGYFLLHRVRAGTTVAAVLLRTSDARRSDGCLDLLNHRRTSPSAGRAPVAQADVTKSLIEDVECPVRPTVVNCCRETLGEAPNPSNKVHIRQ